MEVSRCLSSHITSCGLLYRQSCLLGLFRRHVTSVVWRLQGLDIPDELKELYKTVWELRQRTLVEMAADRGAFIDQSQSFNVHMSDPNFGKLTSLHFHAWKVGSQSFHSSYDVTRNFYLSPL